MLSPEMASWDFSFCFQEYGGWWRKHRREFHRHFNNTAVEQYKPIQVDETKNFLLSLLETPEKLPQHIRRTFASTVMRITHGIPITTDDHEHAKRAEIAFAGLAEVGLPGTFLADLIPLLRHIPAWFPGAYFKRRAVYLKSVNREMRKIPFAFVREQMKQRVAIPSMATKLISELPSEDDPSYAAEERMAENVTTVAFAAGADTTVSTVHALFLAMAMHPEVVKKAHKELDAVVGSSRLPSFDDQPSLHYVNAICKELLRWHMVTPLGIPHFSTEDDVYDGYHIPKGTVVIANGWSILHDPNVFPHPQEFRPERFICNGLFDKTIMDPSSYGTFGFGRRICPGRFLAENSLFLIVASTLAVFDIEPPLDKRGNPVRLEYKATDGLLSYPKPFEVVISPRSDRARDTVRD